MGMSEEQKRRMEANRCAALTRRNCKLQCPVAVESSTSVHLPLQQLPLSPHLDVNAKNRIVLMDSRPHHHQEIPPFNMKVESRKLSDLSGSVNDLSNLHVVKYSVGPSVPNAVDNLQHLNGCGISGQSGAKMKVALEISAPDRFFLMVKSGFADQGFLESISSVSFSYLLCPCRNQTVASANLMRSSEVEQAFEQPVVSSVLRENFKRDMHISCCLVHPGFDVIFIWPGSKL